ncbi:hypothetical protein ACIHDR_09620 [Nocardia sp. NPDC052278]|uniref:hypothetical protein n=1 Tax=unclassified Nocardia TaxID=2637762 RepID=UPI00369D163A
MPDWIGCGAGAGIQAPESGRIRADQQPSLPQRAEEREARIRVRDALLVLDGRLDAKDADAALRGPAIENR